MVRSTLFDKNPVELKYYLFTFSLNECTGSCIVLSPKTCILKEIKDINVKAFNMITNKNEAKAMRNIFHLIVNAISIVQHAIQIKNGIIKHVNMNVKIMVNAKKI